jgi:hypothetical protein
MAAVWRELGNPKRSPAQTAARANWPGKVVPTGLSRQDVALAVFFFHACRYAQHNVLPLTIATWKEKHKKRLQWAEQLREAAYLLNLQFFEDLKADQHIKAIYAAADFFEAREMKVFRQPSLTHLQQCDLLSS